MEEFQPKRIYRPKDPRRTILGPITYCCYEIEIEMPVEKEQEEPDVWKLFATDGGTIMDMYPNTLRNRARAGLRDIQSDMGTLVGIMLPPKQPIPGQRYKPKPRAKQPCEMEIGEPVMMLDTDDERMVRKDGSDPFLGARIRSLEADQFTDYSDAYALR